MARISLLHVAFIIAVSLFQPQNIESTPTLPTSTSLHNVFVQRKARNTAALAPENNNSILSAGMCMCTEDGLSQLQERFPRLEPLVRTCTVFSRLFKLIDLRVPSLRNPNTKYSSILTIGRAFILFISTG
jgi:hypothetical protein